MSNDHPDPGHDHDHAHEAETPKPAAPSNVEDPSAQALSDALRSSFNIVKFLMGLLVAAFIVSGIFTVKPNQVAVVLRFGKPRGTGPEQLLKPGLHWALPYPIDEIVY